MLNPKMRRALSAATIIALGLVTSGAIAATADGTARARMLSQVAVSRVSDLDFGIIVAGTSASTVTINSFGARTCGVGLACTGPTSAAAFSVTGTAGRIVTVSVPASVALSSGTDTMNANLLASAPGLILGVAGASFTVGGVLALAANQADGDYSGTFDATVDYQ